jgi:hypothetical protein
MITEEEREVAARLYQTAEKAAKSTPAEDARKIASIEDPDDRAAAIQLVLERTVAMLRDAGTVSRKHLLHATAIDKLCKDLDGEAKRIQRILDGPRPGLN